MTLVQSRLCITPAGLSSRDWLLRFWHHTGASCWFGAVSKAGWLDGLWQVLFLSPLPPVLALSLSLSFVTPTLPWLCPFTLLSPLAFSLSQAREQAGGSWRLLRSELGGNSSLLSSKIAPPVPWKLSGQVAEGMEGRAARQVGPAIRNLLRHKSHRFSPFSCSCLFYFFTFPFV